MEQVLSAAAVRCRGLVSESLMLKYTTVEASDMATEINETRCHLLDLPMDLRIRIFEFALCKNPRYGILVTKHGISKADKPGALLYACRQIRNEALPVYFKVNTFKFLYSPSKPQTAEDADGMRFGGLMKFVKRMKSIGICTGAGSHFEFSLTAGHANFDLQFVKARSPPVRPEGDITSVLQPVIHRFLDRAIAEAKEGGDKPRLDQRQLVELLVLVAEARRPIGLVRSERHLLPFIWASR